MSRRLSFDVFSHVFQQFAYPEYDNDPLSSVDTWRHINIIPFLPRSSVAVLNSLSLTCRAFRELVLPIRFKYAVVLSYADFSRLRRMANNWRLLPIESLRITSEEAGDPALDFTSPQFLSILRHCIRLESLSLSSPIATPSQVSGSLKPLRQHNVFRHLTSLQLFLPDGHPQPAPEHLVRILYLMPNLTKLILYWGSRQDDLQSHRLPPPPFQLEYLVITQGFWDLKWLTSTSHQTLQFAHIFECADDDAMLNLSQQWVVLNHLHLLGFLIPHIVLQTLSRCPNLTSLALEYTAPMTTEHEMILISFFDALQQPLSDLTLVYDSWMDPDFELAFIDETQTKYDILIAALNAHPKLADLETLTIELRRIEFHQGCKNVITRLREACEDNDIDLAIMCSKKCGECDPHSYFIPFISEDAF